MSKLEELLDALRERREVRRIRRTMPCPACKGSGWAPTKLWACDRCDGHGYVRRPR